MDSDQEYEMLINVFEDILSSNVEFSSENKHSYQTLLNQGRNLVKRITNRDKFNKLNRYVNSLDSKINGKQNNTFSMVEDGTAAGAQAKRLGTSTGFVQRCPECTCPIERCKC